MIQPTFGQVLRETRKMLAAAKCSSPELEARLLVEYASGKTREELVRDLTEPAEDCVLDTLRALAVRRLDGEPVAYLTGEWEFYSLPLFVTRDTLIPRADSEILASRAIELLQGVSLPRVLDLCAGSGCLGLAVAANTNAAVTLADISIGALEVCEKNAALNGLAERCRTVYANALEAPPPELGVFDMIVCNPPYIKSGEIAELDASVRDYEPHAALDGGTDGLDFCRAVAAKWKYALKDGGRLLFETGIGQSDEVCGILAREGFSSIRVTPDLSGIPRVVEAKNRSLSAPAII